MDRRIVVVVALAGVVGGGLLVGGLWRARAPADSTPAPVAVGAAEVPTRGGGGEEAPAATRPADPTAADAPEVSGPEHARAVARWQAEEPIALHAARDMHRWEYVADRLLEAGQVDLSVRARTVAMRLERAMQPVQQEEVRAATIEEMEVLRAVSRTVRDELGDEELLALIHDIEQGAQVVLQGAAPPPAKVPLP